MQIAKRLIERVTKKNLSVTFNNQNYIFQPASYQRAQSHTSGTKIMPPQKLFLTLTLTYTL